MSIGVVVTKKWHFQKN